jgi:S-adenosylmethionine:tRNA ribosyltransferase-isomerase
MDLPAILAGYDYPFSPKSVALVPAQPRDSAKLYIYNKSTQLSRYATFRNLSEYLPKNALLVFNDTKVIPARLFARTHEGEKVELFITGFSEGSQEARVLSNRKCAEGDVLTIEDGSTVIVLAKEGKESRVALSENTSWNDVLQRYGTTPIPPYLHETPLSEKELRKEYQTVFAKYDGSVAAPTASLHFTERVLDSLAAAGIERAFVTLHVNLGTFAPLTAEHIETGKLHQEWFRVPDETVEKIERAFREGRPIIPVGTTSLRTIESAFSANGVCEQQVGTTRLFIQPGYHFKLATGLITNFHVPRSSLMMLVAAFIGRDELLRLYADAQERDFSFFSFGDGMLLLP